MWLHSLKVAQLLRSAACLHTNQSRSYLKHLVNCCQFYWWIWQINFCVTQLFLPVKSAVILSSLFAHSGGCQHVIKNAFYIIVTVNAHAIGYLNSNTQGSLPLEADTGVTNKKKINALIIDPEKATLTTSARHYTQS